MPQTDFTRRSSPPSLSQGCAVHGQGGGAGASRDRNEVLAVRLWGRESGSIPQVALPHADGRAPRFVLALAAGFAALRAGTRKPIDLPSRLRD